MNSARLVLLGSVLTCPVAAQTSGAGTHGSRADIEKPAFVRGEVREESNAAPISNARVTLFRPDLSVFVETRSALDGSYELQPVPADSYRLGVAARGWAYIEQAVSAPSGTTSLDFDLTPEIHLGNWDVIGDTLPETFDATDIGVLRPDGWIFYCHDTTDPILFDPTTGQKILPPDSGSEQGCMNATLLADGSVLIAGGQDGASPGSFVNGIPWVKRFRPNDTWVQLSDMLNDAGRWYPGLARLADGRLLVMGGGQAPDASRTDTCELFDPATLQWSWTGSMGSEVEFPPSALLYTGRVLRTWGMEPKLYDPVTEQWSPTGQFVFPDRGFPGHSDHSLLVLTDGRALVVGVQRAGQPTARMTEYYDAASGQWSAGTSPDLVRFQAEVVYLPDGQVLVAAGDKGNEPWGEADVLGIVKRCDLFDPVASTWRRVADLAWFREYHAVTLLLPDGRVATTGGTRIKFQFGPTTADIEAYSPPYLFRGVRPELWNLSNAAPSRGETLSFDIFPATQLTSVVLMGMQSTTHWVDAGIPRRLELQVQQAGAHASVTLPTDSGLLPLGWYMLFGMVDDIPSEALIVRVDL